DAAAALGLRGGVSELVEQLHLPLAVAPDRIVVRKLLDELLDPRPKLVREMRRRRPDQGVDRFFRCLRHRPHPNGYVRDSAPASNSQGASGGAWRRQAASSVAPMSTDMDAPCVLARRPQSLASNP